MQQQQRQQQRKSGRERLHHVQPGWLPDGRRADVRRTGAWAERLGAGELFEAEAVGFQADAHHVTHQQGQQERRVHMQTRCTRPNSAPAAPRAPLCAYSLVWPNFSFRRNSAIFLLKFAV